MEIEQFSSDQRQAIEKFDTWIRGKDPRFFSLMGCAGTGKTTLAKYFAEKIGGRVLFAAFTGKAAYVLQQAGCENAQTIHSLIYNPQAKSQKKKNDLEGEILDFPEDGDPEKLEDLKMQLLVEQKNEDRPRFKLKPDSDIKWASLVIIDECSMIDEFIGTDLLSYGTPILALGDPGQLPPVKGKGYFIQREPDHLLTQIHRQAAKSPILKLATKARNSQPIEYGDYADGCRVINRATLKENPGLAIRADQIIVGRNKTRRQVNLNVRRLLGREGDPVRGDKLVCLKNNHEVGLLNGSLWEVEEMIEDLGECWALKLRSYQENNIKWEGLVHKAAFRGEKLSFFDSSGAESFDFGYALTCHKSQGSQWNSVLVIDESDAFAPDQSKHLYTAITRACKTVVVAI